MIASQPSPIPTPEPAPPSARALVCLNAITHGATSETLFILGEDPSAFDALLDEAFLTHQPSTTEHAALVTDSVVARWMLWRRQNAVITFEHQLNREVGDVCHWRADHFHTLHLLDRYKTQAERSHHRAFNQLRAIRQEATQDARWQEQLALQKQRFTLTRERFEFAQQKHAQHLVTQALKEETRQAREALKKASPLANSPATARRPRNHVHRTSSSSPVVATTQSASATTAAAAAGSV